MIETMFTNPGESNLVLLLMIVFFASSVFGIVVGLLNEFRYYGVKGVLDETVGCVLGSILTALLVVIPVGVAELILIRLGWFGL